MDDHWSNEVRFLGRHKMVESYKPHVIGGAVVWPGRVMEVVNGSTLAGLKSGNKAVKTLVCTNFQIRFTFSENSNSFSGTYNFGIYPASVFKLHVRWTINLLSCPPDVAPSGRTLCASFRLALISYKVQTLA